MIEWVVERERQIDTLRKKQTHTHTHREREREREIETRRQKDGSKG
mgnify:CR=1 FL=1